MPDYLFAYRIGRMPKTPEEGARGRARFMAWLRDLGEAAVVPATPLGKSKWVGAGGVSDHGADPLSGFSIIRAASLEGALEIAKACPHTEMGTIEVAELMQMPK
jgi:hypothetical protein